MKKKLIFLFILIPNLIFSQEIIDRYNILSNDGKLYLDSLYTNKSEGLIIEKVIFSDGKKIEELKNLIKEWGSLRYKNLNKILSSETDNLITLMVNLPDGPMGHTWTYKFNFQVKEGKFKFQIIEIGNTNQIMNIISPQGITMGFFFTNGVIKSKSKINTFLNMYNNFFDEFESIEKYIKSPIKNSTDW
jgi:hypothetical protein